MSSQPLVSVVVPIYNHARYVDEAIASVLTQDWRPLEVILIDDGSTDDSATVVRRRLDSIGQPDGLWIDFSSRPNQGAHATINEGLRKAKGAYLAILNSDDAYGPGRLRRCLNAAQSHRARMVFSYVDPIDDRGAPLADDHPWRGWYAEVMRQELDLAPSLTTLLLHSNIAVSTGNFFFHRSLLDDVGVFENYRYAHDIDYLLRVAALEEPVILREKLYRYRLHGSNTISESHESTTREYADIIRRYFIRTLETPPTNPLAPSLDTGICALPITPWPPHLRQAVDSLMCDPALVPAAETTPRPTLTRCAPTGRGHVTLVSHTLSRTGAPVLLRDVASTLHGAGVSTTVISLADGPLEADFVEMGSKVLPGSRLFQLLGRSGRFVARIAQDPRMPDSFAFGLRLVAQTAERIGYAGPIWQSRRAARGTVLINSFDCWPLALPLLKTWSGPAFWYIHETFDPRLSMRRGKHLAQFRRLVDQGKVTLLFGSDATRAKWAAEGYDGTVCYWSGLPAAPAPTDPTAPKAPKTGRLILSVQATGPRKGTTTLVEAFAHGRRCGLIPPDVELRIIGCHPPSREGLSRQLLVRITQPDLRGSVNLVPSLPPAALTAHYAAADVYVQSSTMECLPLALLSAMAHGLPIVSTDADGCREAIIDAETGRLIPPRQVAVMAEAIAALLADPAEGARLGAAARARFADRFALEVTGPQLLTTILGSP